jgi:hypothetical protein
MLFYLVDDFFTCRNGEGIFPIKTISDFKFFILWYFSRNLASMKLESAVVAIEILDTRPENANLIQKFKFTSLLHSTTEDKVRVERFDSALYRNYSIIITSRRTHKAQCCPFMWLLNVKSGNSLSIWRQTIRTTTTKCKHKAAFHSHKRDTECKLVEVAGLRKLDPLVFLILAHHVELFNCAYNLPIFIITSNDK